MVTTGFSQVCLNDGLQFTMGGMFMEFTAEKVHTPLFASAWALDDGKTQVIWVSCDLIVMDRRILEDARRRVHDETGLPENNILVSCTHTHTGPTLNNSSVFLKHTNVPLYGEFARRIACACTEAWESRRPAYMGYAQTQVENCCYNRRYMMKDGKSQMHPGGPDNPDRLMKEGPEDRQLQVAWLEDEKGPIGVVVNYSTHASVLYGTKGIVSADFPGVLRRVLQGVYGEVPILYLQGCCGNTSPVNHESDPSWGRGMDSSERVGKILAGQTLSLMASTRVKKEFLSEIGFASGKELLSYREITPEQRAVSDRIIGEHKAGKLEIMVIDGNVQNVAELALANKVVFLSAEREKSPYYEAELSALKLGDVLFVTNPAELFVEYQLNMKKRIPAKHVVGVSITNGWCCYVPTKQAYLLKGYEVDQGWFDWEAGQQIEDGCVERAKTLL
jgi:hypothetical protein